MFRAIIVARAKGLATPPALGYLVSGPLAGPWLFWVLGSAISVRNATTARRSARLTDGLASLQGLIQKPTVIASRC
jgi:hypothetical protein